MEKQIIGVLASAGTKSLGYKNDNKHVSVKAI